MNFPDSKRPMNECDCIEAIKRGEVACGFNSCSNCPRNSDRVRKQLKRLERSN